MPRFAVDHRRGRIVLPAIDMDQALLKAQKLYPFSTGFHAMELPSIPVNTAAPAATKPPTMSKKTKDKDDDQLDAAKDKLEKIKSLKAAASKAVQAKPAPKKKTLGERVEKAASPKQQAKKAAAEGRAEGRRIADAANATGRPDQRRKAAKEGMSGLDAAAKVLADAGEAMNAKDIFAKIEEEKLAPSLKGKTPAATLYAAMLTEEKKKGKASRFIKKGPLFSFNEKAAQASA